MTTQYASMRLVVCFFGCIGGKKEDSQKSGVLTSAGSVNGLHSHSNTSSLRPPLSSATFRTSINSNDVCRSAMFQTNVASGAPTSGRSPFSFPWSRWSLPSVDSSSQRFLNGGVDGWGIFKIIMGEGGCKGGFRFSF